MIGKISGKRGFRSARGRVPSGGEDYFDVVEGDLTVGDVENVPRRLCQDALKLAQN